MDIDRASYDSKLYLLSVLEFLFYDLLHRGVGQDEVSVIEAVWNFDHVVDELCTPLLEHPPSIS